MNNCLHQTCQPSDSLVDAVRNLYDNVDIFHLLIHNYNIEIPFIFLFLFVCMVSSLISMSFVETSPVLEFIFFLVTSEWSCSSAVPQSMPILYCMIHIWNKIRFSLHFSHLLSGWHETICHINHRQPNLYLPEKATSSAPTTLKVIWIS